MMTENIILSSHGILPQTYIRRRYSFASFLSQNIPHCLLSYTVNYLQIRYHLFRKVSLFKMTSKQESLHFMHLPLEIVERILFFAESSDISNVLGVSKSLQNLLKKSFHIVTDDPHWIKPQISLDFYSLASDAIIDTALLSNFKGTYLLQIYNHHWSKENFTTFIQRASIHSSCKISIYNGMQTLHNDTFRNIENTMNAPVESIEMVKAKSFIFDETVKDIRLFSVPKIESLLLRDCQIMPKPYTNNKILFKNLRNLNIDQNLHGVFELIELPSNVSLYGISSPGSVIENLESNLLDNLRFDSCTISTIRNCYLENLRTLTLANGTSIGKLVNFRAPNLTNMYIRTTAQNELLWKNVELPNLSFLELHCSSISRDTENVNCSNLQEANVFLYDQVYDEITDENQFQFLKSAKHLTLHSATTMLLQMVNFENLENLKILKDKGDYGALLNVRLPKLKELFIRERKKGSYYILGKAADYLVDFPKVNAPQLTSITIDAFVKCIEQEDMDRYPKLSTLILDQLYTSKLEGLNIPQLKTLSILFSMLSAQPQIKVTNCQFECLESLIFRSEVCSQMSDCNNSNSIFDITAPNLQTMDIRCLAINGKFSTCMFPRLHIFKAPITNGTIEVCDSDELENLVFTEHQEKNFHVYLGKLSCLKVLDLPTKVEKLLATELGLVLYGKVQETSRVRSEVIGEISSP